LATGEAWELGGGFALTAQQIDLEGDKVWFSLAKNGNELDNEVIDSSSGATNQARTYVYTEDIGSEDDVPVFHCYVDAVFRGTDTNIVQVKFAFLIDNEVLEINSGDNYGIMEVKTATGSKNTGSVLLRNVDTSLDLDEDSKEHIMGDMYFKTGDDKNMKVTLPSHFPNLSSGMQTALLDFGLI
jgi:S-layer protein (TIGR01567 family)